MSGVCAPPGLRPVHVAQLLHNAGRAIQLLDGYVQQLPGLVIRRQYLLRESETSDHRLQGIIDLVCEAGGQPARKGQFLGLNQRLLGQLPLGDILRHAHGKPGMVMAIVDEGGTHAAPRSSPHPCERTASPPDRTFVDPPTSRDSGQYRMQRRRDGCSRQSESPTSSVAVYPSILCSAKFISTNVPLGSATAMPRAALCEYGAQTRLTSLELRRSATHLLFQIIGTLLKYFPRPLAIGHVEKDKTSPWTWPASSLTGTRLQSQYVVPSCGRSRIRMALPGTR